jgi:hypothetical protein
MFTLFVLTYPFELDCTPTTLSTYSFIPFNWLISSLVSLFKLIVYHSILPTIYFFILGHESRPSFSNYFYELICSLVKFNSVFILNVLVRKIFVLIRIIFFVFMIMLIRAFNLVSLFERFYNGFIPGIMIIISFIYLMLVFVFIIIVATRCILILWFSILSL